MTSIDALIDRQFRRWQLDKALASRQPLIKTEVPQVVTVSRQAGSRGTFLAARLADEMGFTILHRETIDAICESSGYRRRIVEYLDERFRNDVQTMIEGLLTGQSVDHLDYSRHLFQVVLSMARLGGVVLVGRGGSFILGPRRGFHIRVVAPKEQRIDNLARYKNLTEKVAANEIEIKDKERRALIAKLFDKDIDDPTNYDLVINLGLMDFEDLVQPTIAAIRAKFALLSAETAFDSNLSRSN